MYKPYTGIGSRKTPPDALSFMTRIARALATQGYTLRSGGADGADTAFELGASLNEIFLPWARFNSRHPDGGIVTGDDPVAMNIARDLHPAWDRLSQGARKLMTRNIHQVLGRDLDTPSKFVICYALGSQFDAQGNICNVRGGTGQAVRLAYQFGVQTFNLAHPPHYERLAKYIP